MEGIYYWVRAYWPLVSGFALTMLGMIGITSVVSPILAKYFPAIPLFLLVSGWAAATFGRNVLRAEVPNILKQPIYWPGQLIFAVAAAAPLALNVFQRGWNYLSILGAIGAAALMVIGLAIGARAGRRSRNSKDQ